MKKKRGLFAGLAAIALVASLALPAIGDVVSDSGFEGADGNLAPQAPTNFDWNSFATIQWPAAPAAPYRASTPKTVGDYELRAFEDAQNDSADTVFAGGTKQDDDCATVKFGPKPPNKDDLKRIYVTHGTKTIADEDHIFLGLAWVRIPQNTTSASAHVGFEFNQANVPSPGPGCPTTTIPGNNGLVRRSTDNGGDMLIVYDFEGSSTDNPTLKLLRWKDSDTDDTGDLCEASGKAVPAKGCWVFELDLTGAGLAQAKVNTSDVGTVPDLLAPPSSATTSVLENLGQNEFGEAIIDLTAAGVFSAGECVNFGQAFGVSRSSGNSAKAQMKDLVGPGDVDIQNCGGITIKKVTVPSPDPNDETFDYSTTGGLDPSTFDLKDQESQVYTDVLAGTYTVTEDVGAVAPDYVLTDISCTTDDGSTISIGTAGSSNFDDDFDEGDDTVQIDLEALDDVECTFTNSLQTGALLIEKNSAKGDGTDPVANAGATFSVEGPGDSTDSFTVVDNDDPDAGDAEDEVADVGVICVSGLALGTYTVNETVAPDGYGDATETDVEAEVSAGTNCTDNLPAAADRATFTNAPLANLLIQVEDGGSGEVMSTIECDGFDTVGPTDPGETAELDEDGLSAAPENVIECTITIDP